MMRPGRAVVRKIFFVQARFDDGSGISLPTHTKGVPRRVVIGLTRQMDIGGLSDDSEPTGESS
jgi:hypothetical protein